MSPRSVWAPVAAMALAVGLVYLPIFSVPPLITTFVDDLGFSHAETGAMMSVCLAGFLVGSLLSGRAASHFGIVKLVVAALILSAVATAGFAASASLGPMLVCRALLGLGGGLIYAPGVTLVTALLPPAKRNLGVGIFLCGLSIGGTIAYFATRLLSDALDWRWPSWIFAAAVLAGALAVFALARPAWRHGFERRGGGGYRAILFSGAMPALCIGLFVALFVAYGVFTWIPPYLDESAGLSATQISLTSGLMTLAGIPATFGIGWLADRAGHPLAVAAVGLALPVLLVVFALAATPSHAGATAVATLAAFGVSGGLGPLYALPPLLVAGAAAAATASGLAAAAAMGGAVSSTYLGGWIVGATDGYDVAFWIYTGAAALTALVLVPLIARRMGLPPPHPQPSAPAGAPR